MFKINARVKLTSPLKYLDSPALNTIGIIKDILFNEVDDEISEIRILWHGEEESLWFLPGEIELITED